LLRDAAASLASPAPTTLMEKDKIFQFINKCHQKALTFLASLYFERLALFFRGFSERLRKLFRYQYECFSSYTT